MASGWGPPIAYEQRDLWKTSEDEEDAKTGGHGVAVAGSHLSLAQLLKKIEKPDALKHWSRPVVEALTRHMLHEDAMGLRGFGVPKDEYEPEAEMAVALLLGLQVKSELFATGRCDYFRRLSEARTAPSEQFVDALRASFKFHFQRDVEFSDDLVHSFRGVIDAHQ